MFELPPARTPRDQVSRLCDGALRALKAASEIAEALVDADLGEDLTMIALEVGRVQATLYDGIATSAPARLRAAPRVPRNVG